MKKITEIIVFLSLALGIHVLMAMRSTEDDGDADGAGGDAFVVMDVRGLVEPTPKTLDEARGQVIASYQDHLEVEWVKSLRKKYTVEVNEEVLYELID